MLSTRMRGTAWKFSPHPPFGHLLPASGEKGTRDAHGERPSPRLRGEGGRRPGEGLHFTHDRSSFAERDSAATAKSSSAATWSTSSLAPTILPARAFSSIAA